MKAQILSLEELVGTTVQGYFIRHLLGFGKLNAVYAAFQDGSQRPALLTTFLVPESFSSDAFTQFRQRFTEIAEKLAQLDHPHILPVLAYGEEHGYPYVITSSFPEYSLAQLLQQGPLTPERTLGFFQQVAAALDYAHLNGVIHGSLKPANVLFDREGNVQIAHLGLVSMLALRGIEISEQPYAYLLSVAGTFLGSPEYMAPEVVEGVEPDARSDVYALGILIYELLSGTLPFTGDDPLEVALRHLDQPLPPLTTLSPTFSGALDLVLQHALDPSPGRRYQTPGKFVAAFERALGIVEKVGPSLPEQAFVAQPSGALRKQGLSGQIPQTGTAGRHRGLLAKSVDRQQIPDLPTLLPLPLSDISPSESGLWQLRPPIITDQMMAIKTSTGSQSLVPDGDPQMQTPPVADQEGTLAPTHSGNLENRATMIFPSMVAANQAPVPISSSFVNQPTIIFPPDSANAFDAQLQQPWNSAQMVANVPDRPVDLYRLLALSDDFIQPYTFLSPNNTFAKVPSAPLPIPDSENGLPPLIDDVPAPVPMLQGRRKTLAILAGGVAAVGLLGVGTFGINHFLLNKLNSPTTAVATPVRQKSPIKTTAPTKKPTSPAKATTPAKTAQTPPKKQNQVGKKSQPTNSALEFANPMDQQASLLIHLPNGNFVAYERACTHEQVAVNYDPQQHLLICPLHHSVFDPAMNAKVLSGPAPSALPPVRITINADGSITV